MDVRTKLEKMKEMGWTIDDFIELIKVIEEIGTTIEDNGDETSIFNAEDSNAKNEDFQKVCSKYLFKLGITPELKGFYYMLEVIKENLLNNVLREEGITKLCDRIAKRNNVKADTVKFGLKTAIISGWEKTDSSVWNNILKNNIVKAPTVNEFVIMFSQRIEKNATLTDLSNLSENDIKLQETCEAYLNRLGLLQTLKGYYFLREVVIERIKHDIELPLKFIYKIVAKRHRFDEGSMRISINNAIRRAWKEGDRRVWEDILGVEPINKCPRNAQLISTLSFLVRNDMGLSE